MTGMTSDLHNDFKFYISEDYGRMFSMKVWLVRENAKGVYASISIDESGNLVEHSYEPGKDDPPKPFMFCSKEILHAFVNAITETVPQTKKEVVDAELIATKFHLEDMRKLVFEKEVTSYEVRTDPLI